MQQEQRIGALPKWFFMLMLVLLCSSLLFSCTANQNAGISQERMAEGKTEESPDDEKKWGSLDNMTLKEIYAYAAQRAIVGKWEAYYLHHVKGWDLGRNGSGHSIWVDEPPYWEHIVYEFNSDFTCHIKIYRTEVRGVYPDTPTYEGDGMWEAFGADEMMTDWNDLYNSHHLSGISISCDFYDSNGEHHSTWLENNVCNLTNGAFVEMKASLAFEAGEVTDEAYDVFWRRLE